MIHWTQKPENDWIHKPLNQRGYERVLQAIALQMIEDYLGITAESHENVEQQRAFAKRYLFEDEYEWDFADTCKYFGWNYKKIIGQLGSLTREQYRKRIKSEKNS